MSKRWTSVVVSIVVSAALIALLLRGETLGDVRRILPEIRWEYAVAAILVGPLVQYLRAWRFERLMFGKAGAPTFAMFRITTYLNFFNYVLPFRIGEASFPVLMKREYGESFANTLGLLLLVRVGDLIIVIGLGGLALMITGPKLTVALGGALLAGALVMLGGLLVMPVSAAGALGRRLGSHAELFLSGLLSLSRQRDRLPFVLLTTALWLVQFAASYLCLLAFGAGFDYLQGIIAGAAATLSFSLPINGIAGIGPAQAAWAYALDILGVDFGLAVGSAILFGVVIFVSITAQTVLVTLAHYVLRTRESRAVVGDGAGGLNKEV